MDVCVHGIVGYAFLASTWLTGKLGFVRLGETA